MYFFIFFGCTNFCPSVISYSRDAFEEDYKKSFFLNDKVLCKNRTNQSYLSFFNR